MSTRIIRISEIATTPKKTGILPVSPATIWRWVRDGKFPKPLKIGTGITAWRSDDIDAFITRCSGGCSAEAAA